MHTSAITIIKRVPTAGDIVISRSTHQRYPHIYKGYLSTIRSINAYGLMEIRGTQGVWDPRYEDSIWQILDTSSIGSFKDISKKSLLIDNKTYQTYVITSLRKDKIYTDKGILCLTDSLRRINGHTISFIPYLSIINKDGIEQQYTEFNYELLEMLLKINNSGSCITLYDEPFSEKIDYQNILDYITEKMITQET